MSWSAEESVLAVTGVLFFAIVVMSFMPRFEMSTMSRSAFAMGAVVTVVLAPLLAMNAAVQYPPLVWLLPLVPVTVMGVLIRDARRGVPQPSVVIPDAPVVDPDAPRRAAFFPPDEPLVSLGEGGDGSARERASDPGASAHELADIAFAYPHLRATIAQNPATPATILEWLASHGDPVINAAIAARSAVRHDRSFA